MESLTGFLHEVTTLLCGVPLPENSLILPMPIATHWDQHFLLQEYQVWLHSTLFNHLVSFLVVSESRHGTNPAKLKPNTASYSFLMFSATRSALPCFVCCSSRHSPGRAATRTYKMSNWIWTTDAVTQVKTNKTIQSQEQCSEVHSVCCIIHQPLPVFVRWGYICFFHLCSQVHCIWRGKEHALTPSPGQFP